MSPSEALASLAHRYGVEVRWRDSEGRARTPSDHALAAVLASLGAPLDVTSADSIRKSAEEALRAAVAAGAVQALPPVVAWRQGEAPPSVPVALASAPSRASVVLGREDGTEVRRRLLEVAATLGTERCDGHHRHRLSLDLDRLGPLPAGYHRLVVEDARARHEATLVVAPPRCPQLHRTWGVSAPLWALRTEEDWGTGSLADLAALAEWTASLGAGIIGTLPLFAPQLGGPDPDPSPYRPSTKLAWNPAFVDTAALAARLGRPAPRPPTTLRRGPLADVAGAASAKLAWIGPSAIDLARATRTRQPPTVGREWRQWLDAHRAQVVFARFAAAQETGERPVRALARQHGANRALAEVAAGDERLGAHLLGQWAADEQLGAIAARHGLYLDLPVGVHPEGFDPWYLPESFVHGASAGAPPDAFYAAGQTWGLPPLHPEGARRGGYPYLVATLRAALAHARAVRIDHVMGLHRLWFVAEGHPATDGAYVRYHAEELRAVVVLEASRTGAAVAGEDLGTVPTAVRRAMTSDGMLRSSVWQFEATPEHPLPDPPRERVASLGTHDLPRFATFLDGSDLAERNTSDPAAVAARRALRRALGGRTDRALAACLEALGKSRARLVLVDLADCFGEREPENRPGTTDPANFARRWPRTLAEVRANRRVAGLLRRVASGRPRR